MQSDHADLVNDKYCWVKCIIIRYFMAKIQYYVLTQQLSAELMPKLCCWLWLCLNVPKESCVEHFLNGRQGYTVNSVSFAYRYSTLITMRMFLICSSNDRFLCVDDCPSFPSSLCVPLRIFHEPHTVCTLLFIRMLGFEHFCVQSCIVPHSISPSYKYPLCFVFFFHPWASLTSCTLDANGFQIFAIRWQLH